MDRSMDSLKPSVGALFSARAAPASPFPRKGPRGARCEQCGGMPTDVHQRAFLQRFCLGCRQELEMGAGDPYRSGDLEGNRSTSAHDALGLESSAFGGCLRLDESRN